MAKTTTRKPAADASGKVEIRFNGEPHHKLVAGGVEIWGGQTGKVAQETAQLLLAASWANVSLADPSAPAWPDSDDELDELAAKVGVELPQVSNAGGSVPLTLADKIAVLEAAGFTPESAAAQAAEADAGTSTNDNDGKG